MSRWMLALSLVGGGSACVFLADLDALGSVAADAAAPVPSVGDAPSSSSSSTSSGGGGSGSSGSSSSSGEADASAPRCRGQAGPTPVLLAELGFCIDATEVTVGQYREFVATTDGAPITQEPRCASNAELVSGSLPSVADDALAMRNVDFCDALAYCTWAGKRLCGSRTETALNLSTRFLIERSEWFAACSHDGDGAHVFPYGNTYEAGRCHDHAAGPVAPGAKAECVGGYPGLFDLSGNVIEWEDACESTDAGLRCSQRGGAYYHDESAPLRCEGNNSAPALQVGGGFGIRCCSDLE